jgi:hypothetical protein
MNKRELELEVARLRGQIEVLERELQAARNVSQLSYQPVIIPNVSPSPSGWPWTPWYTQPSVTCDSFDPPGASYSDNVGRFVAIAGVP